MKSVDGKDSDFIMKRVNEKIVDSAMKSVDDKVPKHKDYKTWQKILLAALLSLLLIGIVCYASENFVTQRSALPTNSVAPSTLNSAKTSSVSTVRPASVSAYKDPSLADVLLSTPELITKYGYPVEEHTVQTKDGYILTHFRIPNGYKGSTGKRGPPIILQHGIFSASDLWILMGREKSLGFILADEGYDVWLTNIRGNRHNRKHLELSPKSKKFWDFSWHEMGHFDMPATIDYILATTGEKKVYYVGHSMGTTMMFVMNSCRPEYNDKIRIAFALAPVAYLGNPKHQLLKGILPSSKMIAKILDQAKLWEILPYNKALAQILASMCRKGAPTHNFCLHIYNLANGPDLEQLNETMLPVYITHLMAGASLKTVHHYAQIMSSGRFQAFDYGPEVNLEKYGQRTPPDYNVENITAPISLHYSSGDLLVNPKGVQTLSRRLPRLVGTSRVIPPKFNHLDFILANDAKPLLFEHILNLLKVY